MNRKNAKRVLETAAGFGAVLVGSAVFNAVQVKRAEARHPPLGKFVTIGNTRLHYVERGEGPPVVLIHGNATMIHDWIISGALDALARSHRVIAFDRPGFGYSDRPRDQIWTPKAQADVLRAALSRLDVTDATVIGHSLGTQVAIALALDHPEAVGRLILLGGYYFATPRLDVAIASGASLPLVGDILSETLSPLVGAATSPLASAKLFSPAPVTEAWHTGFPHGLALRPSQMRAEAADGAQITQTAMVLAKRYWELTLPVTIIAGAGDKISNPVRQSKRLHETLASSTFSLVEGSGHMVHHTALPVLMAAAG
ncbi:MAG: alpha/beta hydrolase [Burkholderiales bacterium]|nr:MAG: alpha/beta hydrolase [Burkholderiales bacterium]